MNVDFLSFNLQCTFSVVSTMKYLNFINNFFAKHSLVCNTVSNAVIMASGDAIVQKLTSPDKHEWERTCKMAFVGMMMAPLQFYFYKNLDKFFPTINNKTIVRKILVDQTLGAPIFISSFFGFCNAWEFKFKESIDEIKAKFVDVYKVDLMIWPAAQYINFLYVPPQFRVLYVSFITVFYTAFLSYVKHQPH